MRNPNLMRTNSPPSLSFDEEDHGASELVPKERIRMSKYDMIVQSLHPDEESQPDEDQQPDEDPRPDEEYPIKRAITRSRVKKLAREVQDILIEEEQKESQQGSSSTCSSMSRKKTKLLFP
ncbi:unnamed protein product [Cochlearia groenlandica]